MTPAELRTICNLIGGQTKLAKLLDIHPTLIRKKLAGKTGITRRDDLAIRQVLNELLLEVREKQKAESVDQLTTDHEQMDLS